MPLPKCILVYSYSTFPSPLQVSTTTTVLSGQIEISVENAGTTQYCSQFELLLPVGEGANDLCNNNPKVEASTPNWVPSTVEIVNASDLGLEGNSQRYARFSFLPRSPSNYEIKERLVFTIKASVNENIGSFDWIIREKSGTTLNELSEKQSQFSLEKVEPLFYLRNFIARKMSSALSPATEFVSGDTMLAELLQLK